MRDIRLHDTRSGRLEPLRPRDPGQIGIYACGPTVYSRIHIGNARPFVLFSLLKRFLEHEGLAVTLVVNITDVNDKIYDAAAPCGSPQRGAGRGDDRVLPRRHRRPGPRAPGPRAPGLRDDRADHRLHRALIDSGHAYPADGDVYFRVRSDPGYGSLSHRRLEDMEQGEATRAQSARRIRWTSRCGRRTSRGRTPSGSRPGAGAARLAHRVLGDGRGVPRRGLRHPRRRL